MKTELKPCPSCGKEAETVETAFFDRLTYRIRCKDCHFSTDFYDTREEAERTWNRRYEPPNEPLTLEELRQMDGKTVWVECERSYGRVISDGIKASVATHDAFYTRPENYTMYRRRPEEVQNEAD